MHRSWNKLLLACMLLLSQTTVVAHDVQHLGSAHGELCAVYLAQDHSADCAELVKAQPLNFTNVSYVCSAITFDVAATFPVYTPRAPPQN